MSALFHHRLLSGPLAPASGAALSVTAALTNNRTDYTVAALATAPIATIIMAVKKTAATEDLRMLASIRATNATTGTTVTDLMYAGRNYAAPYGLGLNTYTSAFTTANDLTLLDNELIRVVSCKIYNGGTYAGTANAGNGQTTALAHALFKLWVGGTLQPMTVNSPPHALRNFTSRFTLGDDASISGITGSGWQGTIYSCYLYLSDLSDAARMQTENFLKAKYAAT